MSDDDDSLSCKEKLIKCHKKESKELQGKILQLKKSVNKDKKRKKEILEEITTLERSLKERHELEISQLDKEVEQDVAPVSEDLNSLNITEKDHTDAVQNEEPIVDDIVTSNKKISKAEKRRQKKAEAAKERELLIKEAEKESKFSVRNVEAEKIKAILKEKKLKMFDINPDGNCLYAALSHQLNSDDYSITHLRSKAANYIRSKLDEFMPFITDPKTGDMLDQSQLEKYCDDIENTPAWGGQPELRALSQTLERRIEVLQAEGSPIIFGEEFPSEKELILAYYRHYYGLGEHYNSVEPWDKNAEDDT